MPSNVLLIVLSTSLILAMGCRQRPQDSSAIKVAGGFAPAEDDQVAKAVAEIRSYGGNSQTKGSGVLIHPQAVLTAWHVVKREGTSKVKVGGKYFDVYGGDGNIVTHPNAGGDTERTHDDLAIIFLPEKVNSVDPVYIAAPDSQYNLTKVQNDQIVTEGTRMIAYGFGATTQFGSEFGSLNAIRVNPIAEIPEMRVIRIYSGTYGSGTRIGDSGGPTVSFQDGKPVLTGVNVFGDENSAITGSVDIRLYVEWIRSTLESNGLSLAPPISISDSNDTSETGFGNGDQGSGFGQCQTQANELARNKLAERDVVEPETVTLTKSTLTANVGDQEIYSIEVRDAFTLARYEVKILRPNCDSAIVSDL
ncbi:MAG: trypsin-like serine protease [Oligoflexales bacterium]